MSKLLFRLLVIRVDIIKNICENSINLGIVKLDSFYSLDIFY